MKNRNVVVISLSLLSLINLHPAVAFAQGDLTPPGPPGPTMKSLDQIEPRTPISSLPLNITNSGSYYLTATLTGVSGTNGITILANNVTVDLMGFALLGVPGSVDGINVGSNTNIAVLNGIVQGWGGNGINAFFAQNGRFERLQVATNGLGGLNLGTGSVVTHCLSMNNVGDGFTDQNGGIYEACIAQNNGSDGFHASGANLFNCSARFNNHAGIWAYNGSLVSGCVSGYNTDSGIGLGFDSAAIGNDCMGNNSAASANDAGIYQFFGPGRIEGNHISYTSGVGIRVAVGQTKVVVIKNTTAGNTNNSYSIPAGNDVGPWGQAATATSPWANIQN